MINNAMDGDVLDAHATLIESVADAGQQEELRALYNTKRVQMAD